MKTSSAYWQKRFQAVEAMNNQTAKGTVQAITPAFDQAQAQIEKEINAWYARFAKNNQISLLEAKKILNTRELKEFRWDVNEYIKHGRQNALDQAWMKQLENASARFHISRLEALKVRTQQAAEMAFGNELDLLDDAAARIYTDGYYHTAYEIQRGLGIGWDIGQIDQNKLRKILDKPWTADKMTFSDRIWKSKTQLIDTLHKEMTQMCVLGKAPDQTISAVAKRMNVSRGQAGRLVMTEAAYFGSAAQKDAFTDLDVEKFEVVATLDNKTSEICQDMDGKVFDMKDFQAGVTAPPFHVWCRSCTAPWFEDNDEDSMRAARDKDGQTYQVPASMKYEDWKKTFVDGGSKAGLTPVVDIDALKNLLAKKKDDLTQVSVEMNIRAQEQTDFLSGLNNPAYKKLHDMSDRELQMWNKVLKDQNDAFTAQMEEVYAEWKKVFDRPARNTPEREAWDAWHENIKKQYGVGHATELYDIYEDLRKKRSVVRDEMNDALGFADWKNRFSGKTKEWYEEQIFNLSKDRAALETEIKDLTKQINDAVKAQAEAAYNARSLREIKDEIIKKHDSILQTSAQKREFADIIEGMEKERANLYDRMSENFKSNHYYQKKSGYYSPSKKQIFMDMDAHTWDDRLERGLHGAWKTKFHEEMHQLDHILATRKSPFAMLSDTNGRYCLSDITATTTVTGKRMIEAIDEDVLNLINEAVDWDVAVNGASVKQIKSLSRISSEAKDATIRYLKAYYPTAKDRASIDTLTDVIGLTTKGNLHPWSHGFWGHDKSYSKDRGKNGATSEAWANLGCFFLRNDTEVLDVLKQVMPKTVETYRSVFDEVMEYAKTNPLTYKPYSP